MSEFGGLWKHKNNQHAFVPPKTECGSPSGGRIRYLSYGGKHRKKYACVCAAETSTSSLIEGLKEEGFQMKQSMLGRFMASSTQEVGTENGVPEVQD